MVGAAQRNCKLIADTPANRAWLRESQVMSIRGPPATDEARLRRDEPKVRAVAVAARFTKCEGAFVDVPGDCIVD